MTYLTAMKTGEFETARALASTEAELADANVYSLLSSTQSIAIKDNIQSLYNELEPLYQTAELGDIAKTAYLLLKDTLGYVTVPEYTETDLDILFRYFKEPLDIFMCIRAVLSEYEDISDEGKAILKQYSEKVMPPPDIPIQTVAEGVQGELDKFNTTMLTSLSLSDKTRHKIKRVIAIIIGVIVLIPVLWGFVIPSIVYFFDTDLALTIRNSFLETVIFPLLDYLAESQG